MGLDGGRQADELARSAGDASDAFLLRERYPAASGHAGEERGREEEGGIGRSEVIARQQRARHADADADAGGR
eukprot:631181-Hanusia_phi.AAC.1